MNFYNREKVLDNNGRSNYITNLKALLITLVVVGHMLTSVRTGDIVARVIYNSIYIFHMPAFIFITGYLSKGAVKSWAKTKKSTTIYVVLYLVTQVIYDLIQRWALPTGKTFDFTILTPRYALWYMLLLIVWTPLLYIIAKSHGMLVTYIMKGISHGENKSIRYTLNTCTIILSVSLALIVGLYPGIGTEYSLSRGIVFFPFYLVGYYFDMSLMEKFRGDVAKSIAILLMVSNVWVQYTYLTSISANYYTGSVSYSGMKLSNIEGILNRGTWMLAGFLLTWALLVLVPRGQSIFTYIGNRTLQIYLIHAIVCRVFYIRGTLIPIKEVVSVWGIIAMGLIFTVILSYEKLGVLVDWPGKLLYNKKKNRG